VLQGTLPERTGACSLFIDSFGRQLSPASMLGRVADPATARPS